ncbi:MAG: hypothetical protein ACE5LH_05655 [Fidelibacterota bacterium]
MMLSRPGPALLLAALNIPLRFPSPAPVSEGNQISGDEILTRAREALLDSAGHELRIRWDYASGEETWSGDGVLQILGEDYLKLILPGQRILVKESTIMAWYRETDQVIVDFFDRRDPGNVFSLFLSGFDYFSPGEPAPLSDSTTAVTLRGKDPGGFHDVVLVVDNRTWLPLSLRVTGEEGYEVAVHVLRSGPLPDPRALREDTLTGSDTVDLRR